MNKEICLRLFERYISGDASPDEVIQLKSFLENDPDLNKWLEVHVTDSFGTVSPDIKTKMLENIRSRTDYHMAGRKKKNIKRYLRRVSNIAAIMLPIVVIFSIYLYLSPRETELYEVNADKGEKAGLTLPEGSTITLNSGSRITYYNDYNRKDRFLKLEGGTKKYGSNKITKTA